MMRSAFLSMDVDSVASHLQGYGVTDVPADGKAYERAVPRLLEMLARRNARCTFFLVAREAARHPAAVRSITDSGSEVACHSMTHPVPFLPADPRIRHRELGDAKRLLEDLTGKSVEGFRAPSWNAGPDLNRWLLEEGYLYDASAYPSWMILLLRRSVKSRSGIRGRGAGPGVYAAPFGNPHPHRAETAAGELAEIPIGTIPLLRIPYYHTLRLLIPGRVFRTVDFLAAFRRGAMGYVFHAVDFLDTDRDGLDPRIRRHPGMEKSLEAKLRLAEEALGALSRRGPIGTLEGVARNILGKGAGL
ncbi:MAG: polysaccharide deacetylase family protein [Bacteroidota bacterium]